MKTVEPAVWFRSMSKIVARLSALMFACAGENAKKRRGEGRPALEKGEVKL